MTCVVLAIVSGICQVSIVWILVRRINSTIDRLDSHRDNLVDMQGQIDKLKLLTRENVRRSSDSMGFILGKIEEHIREGK